MFVFRVVLLVMFFSFFDLTISACPFGIFEFYFIFSIRQILVENLFILSKQRTSY